MSNAAGFSASGSFPANAYLAGDCEFGFGLFGADASADFSYAELTGDTQAAVDPRGWGLYE